MRGVARARFTMEPKSNSNSPTPTSSPVPMSYAQKAQKARKITPITDFVHPTQEQGLIFNHFGDNKIRDYLVALTSLLHSPKDIIAASRVGNNKVIVFLASSSLVDSVIERHKGFTLNETFVKLNRLKPVATKLIFSNVSPMVSNAVLESHIVQKFGLKLASSVSLLRVSPSDELFSHVISFRRQVYVHDRLENIKLPPSFVLDHNGAPNRIFVTTNENTCFICHSRDHKAEDCQQQEAINISEQTVLTVTTANEFPPLSSKTETIDQSLPNTQPNNSKLSSLESSTARTNPSENTKHTTTPLNQIQPKRQLSNITISSSSSSSGKAPAQKKSKSNHNIEVQPTQTIMQIFAPVHKHFQNATDTPPIVSISNLMLFVESCTNPVKEARNAAAKFKVPFTDLIKLLDTCHSLIQHSNTKSRITRIIKELQKDV